MENLENQKEMINQKAKTLKSQLLIEDFLPDETIEDLINKNKELAETEDDFEELIIEDLKNMIYESFEKIKWNIETKNFRCKCMGKIIRLLKRLTKSEWAVDAIYD